MSRLRMSAITPGDELLEIGKPFAGDDESAERSEIRAMTFTVEFHVRETFVVDDVRNPERDERDA